MPSYRLVLASLGLGGLKPLIYKKQLGQQSPAGSNNDYPKIEEQAAIDLNGGPARFSYLGTPVFSDIVFPREGKSDFVIDTVLVDVSMRKNIVTTVVQGRPGTVKEYVSDGDYEVRIRGAIVSNGNNNYPYNDVRDLHELLSRSEALPVVSDYLRLYNIYNLVVLSYNLPQREGFQNVQVFEIQCLSDSPEELIEENASPDI